VQVLLVQRPRDDGLDVDPHAGDDEALPGASRRLLDRPQRVGGDLVLVEGVIERPLDGADGAAPAALPVGVPVQPGGDVGRVELGQAQAAGVAAEVFEEVAVEVVGAGGVRLLEKSRKRLQMAVTVGSFSGAAGAAVPRSAMTR